MTISQDRNTDTLQTLGDILHWAEAEFEKNNLVFGHGTDNAWDEAVAIAIPTLGLSYDSGVEVLRQPLNNEQRTQLLQLYKRRIDERIPAAYLTHTAYFAGLPFYVDERVLVPRSPIAELIEQQFAPWIATNKVSKILDLCTGSGCIAIACAYEFPEANVDAVDLSPDALDVAKKNVTQHELQQRVRLIQSDLFTAIANERYDVIVSNPPYVDAIDMQQLAPEFQHEPTLGLAAGELGLDIVDIILQQSAKHLTEHGILIVEVGNSQQALEEKYPMLPFTWLSFERGGEGVFLLTAAQVRAANVGK